MERPSQYRTQLRNMSHDTLDRIADAGAKGCAMMSASMDFRDIRTELVDAIYSFIGFFRPSVAEKHFKDRELAKADKRDLANELTRACLARGNGDRVYIELWNTEGVKDTFELRTHERGFALFAGRKPIGNSEGQFVRTSEKPIYTNSNITLDDLCAMAEREQLNQLNDAFDHIGSDDFNEHDLAVIKKNYYVGSNSNVDLALLDDAAAPLMKPLTIDTFRQLPKLSSEEKALLNAVEDVKNDILSRHASPDKCIKPQDYQPFLAQQVHQLYRPEDLNQMVQEKEEMTLNHKEQEALKPLNAKNFTITTQFRLVCYRKKGEELQISTLPPMVALALGTVIPPNGQDETDEEFLSVCSDRNLVTFNEAILVQQDYQANKDEIEPLVKKMLHGYGTLYIAQGGSSRNFLCMWG